MSDTNTKLVEQLQHLYGFSDNFIESLQDGLIIITPKGEIVLINDALCRLTGYDKTELAGALLPFPFWPPELHDDYKSLFNELSKEHVKREFKVVYMHKNGKRFPVTVFFASIKNNQDKVIAYIGFIQNIEGVDYKTLNNPSDNQEVFTILNYRKKYLDLVLERKINQQLQITLNNISDGFVTLDEDLCYTYINNKGIELIGKKGLDLIGQNIWKVFPEIIGHPFYKAFCKAIETQSTQCFIGEFKPYKKWFDCRFYPSDTGGITIYFLDISEQEKTEELLSESKNDLNAIINNIGDPLFVKDDQSCLIIVNDAFCKMFDTNRKLVIGKTLAEDVTEQEREAFLKVDKEVLKTGIENISEETLTVKNSNTRTISTRKTRYVDANGSKFIIGTIRDITNRKKTEIELDLYRHQLEELVNSRTEEVNIKNAELQRMNKLFIGRELKMKELKNRIGKLKEEINSLNKQ
ncbi:PAS domain S-box protein [Olleya sp. Ti.3.14]|uniref:PAS domain-containing protein n=1 Tax=Olleya sp. Ti.3.14 TaxID=3121297 RepID=UPI00311DD9D7